jgi:hypothetical protein
MGRSVSTPTGTVYVAYAALDIKALWCDQCGEHFDSTTARSDEDGTPICPHCGADADEHVHSADSRWEFESMLEDFQRQMLEAFPSLRSCDEWLDREDHAIAENRYCYVGVSEYCGLVAMWMCKKDADWRDAPGFEGLRDRWLGQVQQRFRKAANGCFGQALYKQGTFPNGEAFFQPMNGQQQGSMGLGYSSKEGWL